MQDIFRQKTEHAAQVLAPVIRQTPLTRSAPLGELIGGQVWLKQENLQKTRCCKARSAYYMLANLSEAERRHVVTVSTGNNGIAMSWAMAALGIPGTVFLPHTVVPHKVRAIAENRVTIIREGQDIVDAEIVARAHSAEHNYTFRSPYNEWEAMYAQATIGKEIVEELDASGETPDTLLVPVGGGGLIGGIAAYLRSIGREMEIVGVQPANSAVMALSVRAGQILNVLSLPTLSDATAGGVEQGAITYDFCRDQVDDYMVFSEEEIAEAMLYLHDRHGIIVEGAGAISTAALLQNPERFRGRKVALLLCGANVDSALLQRLRSAV